MSALAQLLMRLLAMQMPCRLFCSAWHLFWHANCSDIYWAFGAPEGIRTPDPQIRSLVLYPSELWALIALPVNWATTGPGIAVVLIPHLRNGIPFRAWGSVPHGYFTIRIRNAWAGLS